MSDMTAAEAAEAAKEHEDAYIREARRLRHLIRKHYPGRVCRLVIQEIDHEMGEQAIDAARQPSPDAQECGCKPYGPCEKHQAEWDEQRHVAEARGFMPEPDEAPPSPEVDQLARQAAEKVLSEQLGVIDPGTLIDQKPGPLPRGIAAIIAEAFAPLAGELAEAQKALESLRAEADLLEHERDEATEKACWLKIALETYGEHRDGCPQPKHARGRVVSKCTCGFEQALAGQPAEKEVNDEEPDR